MEGETDDEGLVEGLEVGVTEAILGAELRIGDGLRLAEADADELAVELGESEDVGTLDGGGPITVPSAEGEGVTEAVGVMVVEADGVTVALAVAEDEGVPVGG